MQKSRFDQDLTYLKWIIIFYLLLGVTDTLHHLHAALGLGQRSAIHAVWLGVVLIPLAMLMVAGYIRYRKVVLLWGFLTIVVMAILLPGFYHGGWDHLLKILAFVRVEGESTRVTSLFPSDNIHLWFYEITGVVEFFLALFASYFLYKFFRSKRASHSD